MVTSGEKEGEGGYRGRRLKGQTIMCKINYNNILYNTGNIANIL